MLIILSPYGGSAAKERKKRKLVLDYCSLEALDTNVSMVLASVTSWGRLFQSLIVLGRNEYCWYLAMLLRELLVVSSSLTWGWWLELVLNSISGNDVVVDSVYTDTKY